MFAAGFSCSLLSDFSTTFEQESGFDFHDLQTRGFQQIGGSGFGVQGLECRGLGLRYTGRTQELTAEHSWCTFMVQCLKCRFYGLEFQDQS